MTKQQFLEQIDAIHIDCRSCERVRAMIDKMEACGQIKFEGSQAIAGMVNQVCPDCEKGKAIPDSLEALLDSLRRLVHWDIQMARARSQAETFAACKEAIMMKDGMVDWYKNSLVSRMTKAVTEKLYPPANAPREYAACNACPVR